VSACSQARIRQRAEQGQRKQNDRNFRLLHYFSFPT
jgi:hypothetical protein